MHDAEGTFILQSPKEAKKKKKTFEFHYRNDCNMT